MITYCAKCGGRMLQPDPAHVCDPAGLRAMKRNPFLALILNPDRTLNADAPLVLGGGPPLEPKDGERK